MKKNKIYKMCLIIPSEHYFDDGVQYVPKKYILEEDFEKLYNLASQFEELNYDDIDNYEAEEYKLMEQFDKSFTAAFKRFVRQNIGRSPKYDSFERNGEFDYNTYYITYNVPETFVERMQEIGFEFETVLNSN